MRHWCITCAGKGVIKNPRQGVNISRWIDCPVCNGKGYYNYKDDNSD